MARAAQGTNNETLTVNETQLLNIQMINFPADQRGILLVYATGYTANNEFVPVKRKQMQVPPAAFAAFAGSTDLAGKEFFAALKDWCYEQIVAEATA